VSNCWHIVEREECGNVDCGACFKVTAKGVHFMALSAVLFLVPHEARLATLAHVSRRSARYFPPSLLFRHQPLQQDDASALEPALGNGCSALLAD